MGPGGRLDRHVAQDEGHGRATIEGVFGDGEAHLAGRTVADEADGVDGLGRAAGGDDDVESGEIVASRDGRRRRCKC